MNEADLVKIKGALEKERLSEALEAMERVLSELGYYKLPKDEPPPLELAIAQAQRKVDIKHYIGKVEAKLPPQQTDRNEARGW